VLVGQGDWELHHRLESLITFWEELGTRCEGWERGGSDPARDHGLLDEWRECISSLNINSSPVSSGLPSSCAGYWGSSCCNRAPGGDVAGVVTAMGADKATAWESAVAADVMQGGDGIWWTWFVVSAGGILAAGANALVDWDVVIPPSERGGLYDGLWRCFAYVSCGKGV